MGERPRAFVGLDNELWFAVHGRPKINPLGAKLVIGRCHEQIGEMARPTLRVILIAPVEVDVDGPSRNVQFGNESVPPQNAMVVGVGLIGDLKALFGQLVGYDCRGERVSDRGRSPHLYRGFLGKGKTVSVHLKCEELGLWNRVKDLGGKDATVDGVVIVILGHEGLVVRRPPKAIFNPKLLEGSERDENRRVELDKPVSQDIGQGVDSVYPPNGIPPAGLIVLNVFEPHFNGSALFPNLQFQIDFLSVLEEHVFVDASLLGVARTFDVDYGLKRGERQWIERLPPRVGFLGVFEVFRESVHVRQGKILGLRSFAAGSGSDTRD
jgi:hypothetical protein